MQYTSLEKLLNRESEQKLLDLVDDNRTGNIFDTDVEARINQAIIDASVTVDSYLLGHAEGWPPKDDSEISDYIEYATAIIALQNLWEYDSRRNPEASPRYTAYERVIRYLEGVQSGRLSYTRPSDECLQVNKEVQYAREYEDRIFTMKTMSNW